MATYNGDNHLNKRTEIINTCRHRSKYKLANCKTRLMLNPGNKLPLHCLVSKYNVTLSKCI